MTLWLAAALGFSGFTALWRGMAHPAHLAPGHPPLAADRQQMLRIGGWVLLAASFVLCVAARGWAIGPVLWLGTLTLSAVVLVLGLLPYRPQAIAPLAWSAPVVAGVLRVWLG